LDDPPVISDPRVVGIPIVECGESLVDLTGFPVLATADHPRARSEAETKLWCRRSVAESLVEADRSLGGELRIREVESHRPLRLQRTYWETDLGALRARHPGWSDEDLERENAKFVAPPWITPPHSTGGAVDLVLADRRGRELDLGSQLNEAGPRMATLAAGLPKEAVGLRRALLEAMTSAGFVNYPYEWWHFSYGDRYWAYVTGAQEAIYGGF
jgi:D-alanyl-D-alanine dipeptidase